MVRTCGTTGKHSRRMLKKAFDISDQVWTQGKTFGASFPEPGTSHS